MYPKRADEQLAFLVVSNPADNLQGVLSPSAFIAINAERCFLTKGEKQEALKLRPFHVTGEASKYLLLSLSPFSSLNPERVSMQMNTLEQ